MSSTQERSEGQGNAPLVAAQPAQAVPGAKRGRARRPPGPRYKWIALSNTTLGALMATINSSIILIAMPAIFNGIGINPLAPGNTNYFLWLLLGYMVVTATLLVTFGRISDIFGRVRMYNLGFAIFTLGSILLYLTPGPWRPRRAGADRLPPRPGRRRRLPALQQRGHPDGRVPREAARHGGRHQPDGRHPRLAGSGSFSAAFWRSSTGGWSSWSACRSASVGTIWAFLMLRETAAIRRHQRIDWLGNITFAIGLTMLLVGITYGIEPYGGSPMGWTNPFVIGAIAVGVLFLAFFVRIELRIPDPMFHLELFKIRMFAAGSLSSLLAGLAQGGLQFMLVIWLQGIWLPLHGYSLRRHAAVGRHLHDAAAGGLRHHGAALRLAFRSLRRAAASRRSVCSSWWAGSSA